MMIILSFSQILLANLQLKLESKEKTIRIGQSLTLNLKIIGKELSSIFSDSQDQDLEFKNFNTSGFNTALDFKPKRTGTYTFGPYKLTFNNTNLISNKILINVLPEWDGRLGTYFFTDKDQINLGEQVELTLEIWSKSKIDHLSLVKNDDFEFEYPRSSSSIQTSNGITTVYKKYVWTITPKKKGEIVITDSHFETFPIESPKPSIKINVK